MNRAREQTLLEENCKLKERVAKLQTRVTLLESSKIEIHERVSDVEKTFNWDNPSSQLKSPTLQFTDFAGEQKKDEIRERCLVRKKNLIIMN